MHAAALHLQSKMSTLVACSQCNNAYMYMYLPPNHLMVLCVVFFSRTLLCLKKNDFWNLLLLSLCELCVGRAIMHYWKFSQVELLGFFFRLIAYTCNIRTKFIFTCAGFLKRYYRIFCLLSIFCAKSQWRWLMYTRFKHQLLVLFFKLVLLMKFQINDK